MASLHELKRSTARSYRRVGRGQGSKRGKTSGRGGKGQTARSGHKIRPALRDIIKKLPKRRGYGKNRGRTVNSLRVRPSVFTLAQLERIFEAGAAISPAVLHERGLTAKKSKVKIIGNGASKKFSISECIVTASARAAVEKAGGQVIV